MLVAGVVALQVPVLTSSREFKTSIRVGSSKYSQARSYRACNRARRKLQIWQQLS